MADSLNLWNSKEFDPAVRATAEYYGILPDLIRKDYWVTRVLRAIAGDVARHGTVIFKGGTSLSKGWGLIDRFSEDVDLLLTGSNFGAMPERPKERARQFRALRARIESETPLVLPAQATVDRDLWNFHYMRDSYHCNIRYPLPGNEAKRGAANTEWVLVEMGFRGGGQPHARRALNSLIGEFVATQTDARDALADYAADLSGFEMDLLKPERTFAEKILLLHVAMAKGDEGAQRVPTRHYYDVAQMFKKSEDVKNAISSGAMQSLLVAAAEVSNAFFGANIDPSSLKIRESLALTPTTTQLRLLRANYESPLEQAMYFRGSLPFDELMNVVRAIRDTI
ncbi:MAG TPA: nucleotidyl transferase AbiEii/AbiGii toxin family protein [Gemmatimonadaceae bacterium]|nr:nucleotidyl transferase AbiEii/AbiGii toxin family protein [Gemmatimonadaceae bacterium]